MGSSKPTGLTPGVLDKTAAVTAPEFDPKLVEQAARTVRDHSFAGCDITFNDAGGATFCDGTSLANGDFASASEAREIHLALAVLTAAAPTLRAEGAAEADAAEQAEVSRLVLTEQVRKQGEALARVRALADEWEGRAQAALDAPKANVGQQQHGEDLAENYRYFAGSIRTALDGDDR